MDGKVIHESIVLSLEGKIAFPAVVQRLIAVGTERYYADLVRLENVFYSKSGETHIERLPLPMAPEIAEEFEEGLVVERPPQLVGGLAPQAALGQEESVDRPRGKGELRARSEGSAEPPSQRGVLAALREEALKKIHPPP